MPYINGIGVANPGQPIAQEKIAEFMKIAHRLEGTDARKLDFLYRRSGIDFRHSVLRDFEKTRVEEFEFFPKNKNLEPEPKTAARMDVFAQEAPPLATRAVQHCLEDLPVQPEDLSHLILVSCTGMMAPGVELALIQTLKLNPAMERYCLHFMGCYAAITGIKLADKILRAEPEARVLLVSVELCTLHFQKNYTEDNLLANSLFADGSAAAILSNDPIGLKVKDYSTQLLPEGTSDMAWKIGNFGFEMRLSKYVPGLLQKGIGRFADAFEKKYQLSEIRHFAVHPGGKQILTKVQEEIGFDASENQHAAEILRLHGNMSSSTILFVLKRMLADEQLFGDILALGFGPGLTLETLLVEKL